MGIITTVSTWIIPCFILLVLVVATWKRIPTYELFVEGGKEGVKMAFSLLPFLVGMIVAIAVLRSSGALEAFIDLISPALVFVGIPPDIIPLAIVRPISGTAALGMTTELVDNNGPDSFIGRLASTMQGSTEDRKSTRLNSSHVAISYAVFGLKKKRNHVAS